MIVRIVQGAVTRWSGSPQQLILLLLSGFLLSGCVSVDFGSTFNRDGTAMHQISVTFPRSGLDQQNGARVYERIAQQSGEAGLQVERIIDGDTVTVRISNASNDVESAGAALNALINASGISDNPGISAPFTGRFEQQSGAVGSTGFQLDLTVDGTELLKSVAALASETQLSASASDLSQQVTITYTATLPGHITSTNGERLGDSTVRWQIANGSITKIHAESSPGDSSSTLMFVITSLALTVITVGLAIIIGLTLIRRQGLTATLRSAALDFPRQTTITREGSWVTRRILILVERLWQRSGSQDPQPVETSLLEQSEEEE